MSSHRLLRISSLVASCVLAHSVAAQSQLARTSVAVHHGMVHVNEFTAEGPLIESAPASPAGVVWSYNDAGHGWIGTTVAIGDHGGQVFTELHKNAQAAVLLSSFDHDPASEVWSDLAPSTDSRKVVSTETTDLHVVAHELIVGALRRVEVNAYRSSSSVPRWSYSFAPLIAGGSDIGISRDGERVVAGIYNALAARVEIAVFDGEAGALLSYSSIPVTGALHAFELSADGSTLLFTADTTANVFDIASATVVFSIDVATSLDAAGISGDGRVLAFGGFNWMRVWERTAPGAWASTFTRFVPGSNYVAALTVSDDGSTIAYGFNYYDTFLNVRIEAFDVATKAVTMVDVVTGTGSLQNNLGSVAVCADGSHFAVGVWGDELNTVPELRYYSRNRNLPLELIDMPGSVYSVAISADGRRVAAAGKAVHANTLGNGGSIVLYDGGGADLTLEGIPQAGTSPIVHLHGPAGHGAVLLVSEGAAQTPVPFYNGGLLYLDRDRLDLFSMGVIGANGVADLPFALPSSPNIIGATLYLQGLTTGPRTLTAAWLPVTILP